MKGSSRKFLVWLVVLALLTGALLSMAPWAAAQGGYTLTVLHTNDVHAHILQFNSTGGDCSQADAAAGKCFGGVARRATEIAKVRAEGGNVLLVDAGDEFQGTLFYTKYKGEEAQRFMNEMGYQAMAVGNHEFDDGPGVLGSFVRGAKFPVLSANLDVSQEPELAGLIKPYVVLQIGGEKVGVVGLTTEEVAINSSPGPHVAIEAVEAAAKEAIGELEKAGVNKIVALSHVGFDRDKEVAAAIDGLDVIVGGHTHTYLSNTDPAAEGPYPVVVKSPGGKPVLVVSDAAYGQALGRLDVTFDADGVPTAWQGNPIALDASVPEDAKLLAEAQSLNTPLEALRSQVIGAATVNLVGDRAVCRFEECTMGDLIADAMLWATAKQGTQIAFENGGGVRASIQAGDVSLGNVLEVLPFGNTLATFELSGADVWAALENGVSRAEDPANEGTGRFAQVAGLRYTWNPKLPAGARLVSVEVKNPDGTYGPLDPKATYKVATNDFNRRGGDDYTMFAEKAINPYDFGPTLDKVVADYIAAHSPLAQAVEGRVVKSEAAAPAALPITGGVPLAMPSILTAAGFVLAGAGVWMRRRA
jgi:5'-nucleotidase/UDP-sugar diphosphatase